LLGLLAGTLFGFMWFYLSQSGPLNEVYYNVFDFRISDPLFGFYLAMGALLGDMLASFFKRQMGLKRGQALWGVDQLDFVFGALLFAWIFAPTFIIWEEAIALIFITIGLHLFGNQIAYYTKRKAVRW
jgi:CDP-2,3-bis-(O-geranylgeranyl)-sn-glycerol synthase